MPAKQLCLFDSPVEFRQLFPLTMTRPIADLRIGIYTQREKWSMFFGCEADRLPSGHLAELGDIPPIREADLYLNSSILPDLAISQEVQALDPGTALYKDGELLACRTNHIASDYNDLLATASGLRRVETETEFAMLRRPWDLFALNEQALRFDFKFTFYEHRPATQSLPEGNRLIGNSEALMLCEGAKVEGASLNTSTGPIYIAPGAKVMEGSLIRGPFALLPNGVVKMGAKIYGATTIGPYCKVGGELNNVVMQAYSNKGHDGFVGNSVIGEWCNLGADTNTSNLKNNYGPVRSWSYAEGDMIDTGRQFCGLVMGDHSKTAINTQLNTGTVVGVCANIFGGDFPPKFVPSFSWGGASGFEEFKLDKAFEAAGRMMERRGRGLSEAEMKILTYLSEQSKVYHT